MLVAPRAPSPAAAAACAAPVALARRRSGALPCLFQPSRLLRHRCRAYRAYLPACLRAAHHARSCLYLLPHDVRAHHHFRHCLPLPSPTICHLPATRACLCLPSFRALTASACHAWPAASTPPPCRNRLSPPLPRLPLHYILPPARHNAVVTRRGAALAFRADQDTSSLYQLRFAALARHCRGRDIARLARATRPLPGAPAPGRTRVGGGRDAGHLTAERAVWATPTRGRTVAQAGKRGRATPAPEGRYGIQRLYQPLRWFRSSITFFIPNYASLPGTGVCDVSDAALVA